MLPLKRGRAVLRIVLIASPRLSICVVLLTHLLIIFFFQCPNYINQSGLFKMGLNKLASLFGSSCMYNLLKYVFLHAANKSVFFRYFSCIVQYLAFLVTVLSATRLLSCGCPDISSCMFFLLELYTVSQKNCAFLFLS